jgi:hypothetical protein
MDDKKLIERLKTIVAEAKVIVKELEANGRKVGWTFDSIFELESDIEELEKGDR